MHDDYRKIIIRRIIHEKQAGAANESSNTSPVNRWAFYLTLIPAVIVVIVLGAFFFSIVLALFVAVAAVIGARLWWLRRKFRRAARGSAEEKDGAIEDAEILEVREDSKRNRERY